MVKSWHAAGGAQYERVGAPQTAARKGCVGESEKLVPFGWFSTSPEGRCKDCKAYLLSSGRRLERIDSVGKTPGESSEARPADASQDNDSA